jgi:uncharacterized protein
MGIMLGMMKRYPKLKCLFENFIFYPRKTAPSCTKKWRHCEISFDLNNQHLQGWLIKNERIQNGPFVIYYGGNAEDIALNLTQMEMIDASSFLFLNYRGYGSSSGKPTQQGLLEDALSIYDVLIHQYSIPASRIFLLGRSIGSCIATYVASLRKVGGLILVTPFDSVENLVREAFRWIPLGWFFKNCFDTRAALSHVSCKTLVLAAEKDEVIPQVCLQSLLSDFPTQIEFEVVKGADHQDIGSYAEYYAAINIYLQIEFFNLKKIEEADSGGL